MPLARPVRGEEAVFELNKAGILLGPPKNIYTLQVSLREGALLAQRNNIFTLKKFMSNSFKDKLLLHQHRNLKLLILQN